MTTIPGLAPGVTIFAQPPGVGFVAFLLSNIAIPTPGRVRLDLSETEDYTRSYQLTRNPVEQLIAQNRVRLPDTLAVTGMLSAHPLLSPVQLAGLARLDKMALRQLKTLGETSELLFIVTPERPYKNMVLTRLREHYGPTTGLGVELTLEFEEVLFAIPGLVSAEFDPELIDVGASANADLGTQTPAASAPVEGLG